MTPLASGTSQGQPRCNSSSREARSESWGACREDQGEQGETRRRGYLGAGDAIVEGGPAPLVRESRVGTGIEQEVHQRRVAVSSGQMEGGTATHQAEGVGREPPRQEEGEDVLVVEEDGQMDGSVAVAGKAEIVVGVVEVGVVGGLGRIAGPEAMVHKLASALLAQHEGVGGAAEGRPHVRQQSHRLVHRVPAEVHETGVQPREPVAVLIVHRRHKGPQQRQLLSGVREREREEEKRP